MRKYIITTVLFILFAGFVLFQHYSAPSVNELKTGQLEEVLEEFYDRSKPGDFFVIMFFDPADQDSTALNIQFSHDDTGVIGLDWLLLGDKNIQDQNMFTDFVEDQGFFANRLLVEDVELLRVEQGNLLQLGEALLYKMYRLSEAQPLEIMISGYSSRLF